MNIKKFLARFTKNGQKNSKSMSAELEEIFNKESINLLTLDRAYFESVASRIDEFNNRILSIKYEKDLGRLRIVYSTFYIDLATVDKKLVDLLALFGLGIPTLNLVINNNKMKLTAKLKEYVYDIEILGVNVSYDIENIS